jgi:hypothetical protein
MRRALIRFNHREDYGHDFYVQILNTGKHFPRPFREWSLIQMSFSLCHYPGWPYIQIKMGSGGLFSVLTWAWKVGFDLDIISHTWKYDHLDQIDDVDLTIHDDE